MGYHRAGFDVVGVDIAPQPRYPFEFHRADALTYPLDGFDVIHASPPCQAYSQATLVHGMAAQAEHPRLIEPIRARLLATGRPYVIENVPGAPLLGLLLLCGSMFGLAVRRHRIFEGAVPFMSPYTCSHAEPAVGVYGHTGARGNRGRERQRGRTNGVADWQRAMGIDWMTTLELAEAIPPAYTEWIGRSLLALLVAA
jgi:DNA (cytosine-5)-methyltransferase 1